MTEEQQAQGMSKSAKRRAAQKRAKENATSEVQAEEAPKAPPSQPKAKAKAEPAKAAAPAPAEPKAKAKAKAEPKAQPKAEPKAEPKAQPKAKPKAQPKAEPKAEPKEEPKAEAKAPAKAPAKAASKPAAKSGAKSKAAAKGAAKPVEEEAPRKREPSLERFIQLDDGTGGDWEVSTGLTKKQQRRKERVETEKAEAKAAGIKPGQTQQFVPGMGPIASAPAGAPAASQAVAATPAQAAAVAAAAATAAAAAAAAAVAQAEKEKESNSSTASVKVPEAKIGIVIGPKGSKIKLIQEKTGTRIDTSGEMFTITGPPAGVREAEAAVADLVEKGYTALEYDDFQENFVAVHPSYFPDIIGKGGVVIRKIKDELGVAVKIPEAPKNPPAGKKYKVMLAGKNTSVEQAKEVINDIMMYYHHPITHEGMVHEEIEVAPWAYAFIIGKAGSELRHIQNNYKVKMNIPRDHSMNQNVVIVGEAQGVERAKAYVEKLVWNAEHAPRGRGAADQAEDTWGDEGADEPWMKEYMYKR